MPNLDKTGPQGVGPTGLQKGGCVTPSVKGFGRGRGQRRGRGSCPYFQNSDITLAEEKKLLQTRLEEVEQELENK